VVRLEQAITAALPDWSLSKVVTALMAVRGLNLISAVIFLAEIGDLSRFASPRQLMAYLGPVPGEQSTGETIWRGGITKAGNHRARRVLVECSWSYRHPPRVGKKNSPRWKPHRALSRRSPGRRRRV
jgi:transposase